MISRLTKIRAVKNIPEENEVSENVKHIQSVALLLCGKKDKIPLGKRRDTKNAAKVKYIQGNYH